MNITKSKPIWEKKTFKKDNHSSTIQANSYIDGSEKRNRWLFSPSLRAL